MTEEVPHDPLSRPDAEEERRLQRVRRAVLERIAIASTPEHLTVRGQDGGWQPFLEGVRCKVLHEHGDVVSYLLELAPGAVLPAHRHPVDEECIVLRGELRIGDALRVGEGDYHLGRAGVLHASVHAPTGALIFLRGAAPDIASCL